MTALKAIRWTIWYRNHRILPLIALYFLALGPLFYASNHIRLNDLIPPCLILIGIFALLFIFGVFIHQDADVGTKGSSFPAYLFQLPIRTWQLVVFPMAIGSVVMIGSISYLCEAARLGGNSVPIYWPPALAAAILAMLQAIFWYPIGISYSKMVLTILGLPGLGLFAGIALDKHWSEVTVSLCLIGFTLAMYGTAYNGVVRARQGEGQILGIQREEAPTKTSQVQWKKPFSSAKVAQRWYEWRQHGIVLPALTIILFVIFLIPLQWNDTNSPIYELRMDGSNFVPTVPTYIHTYILELLGAIPFMAWIVGCGARRTDIKATDRSLHLFFGIRPMSDSQMIGAKLFAAIKSALLAWAVLLVCLLMMMVFIQGGKYDTGSNSYAGTDHLPIYWALAPYLTTGVVITLLGSLLIAVFVTIRNYVVGFWLEQSGIPMIGILYPFGTFILSILATLAWSTLAHSRFQAFATLGTLTLLIWIVVCVRLCLAVWLIQKQLALGILTGRSLVRGFLAYCGVLAVNLGIILTWTDRIRTFAAQSDFMSSYVATAYFVGLVVLWTPFVRILLVISMLHRNRHRSN